MFQWLTKEAYQLYWYLQEYEGYLMTEKYDHKASAPYLCVDADPEAIEGLHAKKMALCFILCKLIVNLRDTALPT